MCTAQADSSTLPRLGAARVVMVAFGVVVVWSLLGLTMRMASSCVKLLYSYSYE
jgi:hypothetical protein